MGVQKARDHDLTKRKDAAVKAQAGRAASYYPDTGCKEAPSCLNCPLPQCVYDSDRQEAQRLAALERAREKVRLIQEKGWTVPEAARHFGVTHRTISRLLQKAREAA